MTLFRHEIKRGWKSTLIWSAAIGGFLALCMLLFPPMKDLLKNLDLSEMLGSMGGSTAEFAMGGTNFGDLKNYYGSEADSILGLAGAVFAALLGIGMLAKEEKSGTAEFLLAHPVTRAQVVTSKLAAMLVQITALNIIVYLMGIGSVAVIGEAVPWKEITLLHFAYFVLQAELACVCFGISSTLWKGGTGVGLGITIAMYCLNIVAALSDKAKVLKYITPFGYADFSVITTGSIDGVKMLIGVAAAAAGAAFAYMNYCKKDIR